MESPWELNFDSAPFCNGSLHLGHVRNYALGDVRARWLRQKGVNVEYTSAFDAFGLPNEEAARAAGVPADSFVAANEAHMSDQFRALALSYSRIPLRSYAHPSYYRWTQWLFLRLWEAGLVYRRDRPVPFCPRCESHLAAAEILDDRCARCGADVVGKRSEEWFIRTSEYSNRLYNGIDGLVDWSDCCRNIHRAYLGRMEGRHVDAEINAFGGTYRLALFVPDDAAMDRKRVALRSDHLLGKSLQSELESVSAPREWTRWRRRGDAGLRDSVGLRLLLDGRSMELVLLPYGEVPEGYDALVGPSTTDDLEPEPMLSGRTTEDRPATTYRIQDWLVSRRRSWGTPLPAVRCETCGLQPVHEGELPIRLPEHGGSGAARCASCESVQPCEPRVLDCFMDDCWCFYATVPDWNPDENPFEAWKRRPAERVHFHTGYDTFVYPLFFRFTGYFLHNLGYTPRPEPIDFFPGHDVVTLEGKKLSKSHENAPDLDSLLEEWGGGVVRLSVLAGSNPDREISWSTGRLELGRRMLDTVDQLVALQAACSEAPQTEPVATNGGRAAARIAKDLERIDRFVGEYRIGAAVDALYKCSSAALRSGRTVRDVEMRRVCDGLISWWRAFAPENVLHAAPRVS